jgi:hypothetical protein
MNIGIGRADSDRFEHSFHDKAVKWTRQSELENTHARQSKSLARRISLNPNQIHKGE